MAAHLDPMTERAQSGWRSFSWFIGLSSLAVVIVLGLMAIFLL